MSTSMNQSSLFGDQEDQIQIQIQIPAQMALVPFPTNLSSSFLPLSGGAIAGPSSLSSSEEGLSSTTTNSLVETLLASTLHRPQHQDLISTSSLGAVAGQQLLPLNRSSANSWAWGGVTGCLMGKRSAGGEYGHHDRHRHHQYIGIPAMKMKKILKVRRKVREPRFCFKTMSDVDVLDDGYKWRKYGQKVVKNTEHPRSYYRCTQDNCRVKKRVERLAEDPRMVITTYEGRHVHSPSNDLEDSQTPSAQLNDFLW